MQTFTRELLLLLVLAIAGQALGETRKVVAVVDTGLPYNSKTIPYLCKGLQYDLTEKGIQDIEGHGTNVMGIISSGLNPKTHCISMIKWWHDGKDSSLFAPRIISLMKLLPTLNPVLVNMSFGGELYMPEEANGIKLLLAKGVRIVVSAGNDKQNLSIKCDKFPACYPIKNKNFYVVGASNVAQANYGGPITDYLPAKNLCGIFGVCMSGTSQAAASKSAQLLQEMK
jgi:hypothetical protein